MENNSKYYGYLDRILGETIYEESKQRTKAHQSSGKISPSKLAYPTQTALLSLLGFPADPIDDRVLRIFRRGTEVEQSVSRAFKTKFGFACSQTEWEYRKAIGYADIDSEGIIIEIKSTNQARFWHMVKEKKPQPSHAIQTAYYLAAAGRSKGFVCYVNADNYATLELPIYSKIWKPSLDYRIDAIQLSIIDGTIPDFVCLERFHQVKKYNPYPQFYGLKGAEVEEILRADHPEIYQKLKNKELISLCDQKPVKNLTRFPAEWNISWKEMITAEIATSSCGENCARCSIRRLNDQYELTEKSRLYLPICLRLIK